MLIGNASLVTDLCPWREFAPPSSPCPVSVPHPAALSRDFFFVFCFPHEVCHSHSDQLFWRGHTKTRPIQEDAQKPRANERKNGVGAGVLTASAVELYARFGSTLARSVTLKVLIRQ